MHARKMSWVFDKSAYMRDRTRTFDREIRDFSADAMKGEGPIGQVFNAAVTATDRATGGRVPHWMAAPKLTDAFFSLIQVTDNVIATMSWIAGYRLLYQDWSSGNDAVDLLTHGPQLGLAFNW